jgi:ribonucleotide monophosphatase NagD (HAD superfamily)
MHIEKPKQKVIWDGQSIIQQNKKFLSILLKTNLQCTIYSNRPQMLGLN